ncbi:hypothetical protein COCCADRAFT_6178 [Bipolaris zeicola 26-R-13]|uniref:Uncharacterized protein n=1 Tax=Cochliobolus carbonum (strain 26-R-13) TaxID=930089 RepID=W6Y309_COCC2|nr:uncharacterized protein COCCADRAFT_6178 [Bipolaris zeicola 26-R-13]EUC32005.1 hypothetical protein COCCADRAFT_6178 [Bipolaris zeicola 26-R-13]
MSQSVPSTSERKSETTQGRVEETNTGSLTENAEMEDSEERANQQETSEIRDTEDYLPQDDSSVEIGVGSSDSSSGERSVAGSITGQEQARNPYRTVEVLLLTFKYTDLDLRRETGDVWAAFVSLDYTVTVYEIQMTESLEKLQVALDKFLKKGNNETLLIIYYHGHGGLAERNRFALHSHNYPESTHELWSTMLNLFKNNMIPNDVNGYLRDRNDPYQPIAQICWTDISGDIMMAECDTLVILDCCNAGLAAVTSTEDEDDQDDGSDSEDIHNEDNDSADGRDNNADRKNNSTDDANHLEARKELIGACGWGVGTTNHMSPAMCTVFEDHLRTPGSNMSTFRLVHEMNRILVRKYICPPAGKEPADIPQAVHYVLRHQQRESMRRVRAGKIVLPGAQR